MWRFVPVVCFKVVWLKEVKLWKFPGCLLVGLYDFNLVVIMSPEYESRKCELRPVTDGRTKTGKWIKARLNDPNVTKDRLTT